MENSNKKKFDNVIHININKKTPKQSIGQKRFTRKIRNYLDLNENEDTTYLNVLDATNSEIRGNFITVNSYI